PQGSAILRAAATGRPAPDRPAPPAAPRGRTWPGGGRRSRRPRASARPRTSPGWSVSLPVDTFERLVVSHPTNTPERANLCSSGVDGSQDTVGEEGHASEPFAAGGGGEGVGDCCWDAAYDGIGDTARWGVGVEQLGVDPGGLGEFEYAIVVEVVLVGLTVGDGDAFE